MTEGDEPDNTAVAQLNKVFAAGGFARGIGRTLGIRGVSAEPGGVHLEGSPDEDHYNPLGAVHGGYIATMLDAAVALAVQTVLPAGTAYATTDLHVTFLRALTAASGPVRAEGRIVHRGRRAVLGEARLFDREGRLCAHATANCAVLAQASAATRDMTADQGAREPGSASKA